MKDYNVIICPLTTEKSVRQMELENKLVFIVNKNSKKSEIKKAVENMFSIKVNRVNTHIMNGKKYAIVKLNPDFNAMDIANQLGII